MNTLLDLVESLAGSKLDANGKSPVRHLGFISCANRVHIKHVPFYDPCVVMVLSGTKVVFDAAAPVTCEAGAAIAVPAPASFDLRNEPDSRRKRYNALVIPFRPAHLDDLRRLHGFEPGHRSEVGVLKFDRTSTLEATIRHYLESPDDALLLKHRLMEILLYLARQDARMMSFALAQENWSHKVHSIVSGNLVHDWSIGEVSERLDTSETTLRRRLRQEQTSFRELVYELRLTSALMQLLQTSLPVYQIAYDCGYQSVSRFTSNFRKRFGVAPTALRASMAEKEQHSTAMGHSQAL